MHKKMSSFVLCVWCIVSGLVSMLICISNVWVLLSWGPGSGQRNSCYQAKPQRASEASTDPSTALLRAAKEMSLLDVWMTALLPKIFRSGDRHVIFPMDPSLKTEQFTYYSRE